MQTVAGSNPAVLTFWRYSSAASRCHFIYGGQMAHKRTLATAPPVLTHRHWPLSVVTGWLICTAKALPKHAPRHGAPCWVTGLATLFTTINVHMHALDILRAQWAQQPPGLYVTTWGTRRGSADRWPVTFCKTKSYRQKPEHHIQSRLKRHSGAHGWRRLSKRCTSNAHDCKTTTSGVGTLGSSIAQL